MVASQDRAAFQELHGRYAPRMFGLILTVVRDRTLAEDVLQNVLLEIWNRHAARYVPALGKADGWLLRLANSRAIDAVRSVRRSREISHEESALPSRPADAGGAGGGAAEQATIRAAISGLPEEERVPVVLAYVKGYSREEIAAHCSVPVGTVKTRIRRGLARLRESMGVGGIAGETGTGAGGVAGGDS